MFQLALAGTSTNAFKGTFMGELIGCRRRDKHPREPSGA